MIEGDIDSDIDRIGNTNHAREDWKMGTFDPKQDFAAMELEILNFWEEHRCFEKLQEKNAENKPFRFLDGPITANNPMGIHHAWGRTIKDVFLRYKAMQGYSCHYRNGFDTQGLWVEVEVEKELGFTTKKDIEDYGSQKFIKKCLERVEKFSGIITDQSKRLGQWMDWENSYYTHTDENISGIWSFLKKCHANGWITQSYRPMPWCPRCGTSLSEHEMTGSYREIEHTAVYVKLPLREREWDILVWTTTPWTLTANVALAVHPELEYCVVKAEGCERPLVLAKQALKLFSTPVKVLQTLRGSELTGLHYETCFPHLHIRENLEHKVVPWEMVSAEEGSGVVHIAPGCGAEDYELGQRLGLSVICPIDEAGAFLYGYGGFTGLKATEAAPLIFSKLDQQGKLFRTHPYKHSYPVCWRCKTEVLFRFVREWYIKTDEIRPKLLEAASTVKWEPEYIGKRMQDWLANMGDWNISRKRFYGLPLPFYPCEKCGKLTVVGSKGELQELGGTGVDELPKLHRPWIDAVKIQCPACGSEVSRVQEVGDVWLDAGITPFTTLGYFKDRKRWEQYFPAEWVTEMREQVRLWFYSLLFMSVTLEGRVPYERVLAYNSVVAEDGTKFSKTGFMIRFDEAAEKLGADTIRYLFAGANTASDVRFGFTLGEEARRKLLSFWNLYVFFMTYAVLEMPDVKCQVPENHLELSDRWLTARTHGFVGLASELLEDYKTPEVIKAFELFVDDVSNWYIRINRRRFWKQGSSENKQAAYQCLYRALKAALQVMAPVLPFMTEYLWQTVVRVFEKDAEESVHLSQWPSLEGVCGEAAILKETDTVRKVIGLGLKVRNEKQLKVKQPLATLFIVTTPENAAAVAGMLDTVKEELNVKNVEFLLNDSALSVKYLTLNFKKAGSAFKGQVQALKTCLEGLTGKEMEKAAGQFVAGNPVEIFGWREPVDPEFLTESTKCRENIAVAAEADITVAMDIALTEELMLEGLYRELLRQCQLLRKEAGFRVEQRILLGVKSESEAIRAVIERYGEDLREETLALKLEQEADAPVISKEVEVGGYPVQIDMSR